MLNDSQLCFCPCSPITKPPRKKMKVSIHPNHGCKTRSMNPMQLMNHLEKEGDSTHKALLVYPNKMATFQLGWEFRFLVPISGTPIVSRITIPFLIPKIPVGKYFLNSDVWRVRKSEFRLRNFEFRYLIRKQILIPPSIPRFMEENHHHTRWRENNFSCQTYIYSLFLENEPTSTHT